MKEQAEVIQYAVHKKEASKFCAWQNGEAKADEGINIKKNQSADEGGKDDLYQLLDQGGGAPGPILWLQSSGVLLHRGAGRVVPSIWTVQMEGTRAIGAPAIGAPALSSGAKIVGAQVAALQLCIERVAI